MALAKNRLGTGHRKRSRGRLGGRRPERSVAAILFLALCAVAYAARAAGKWHLVVDKAKSPPFDAVGPRRQEKVQQCLSAALYSKRPKRSRGP